MEFDCLELGQENNCVHVNLSQDENIALLFHPLQYHAPQHSPPLPNSEGEKEMDDDYSTDDWPFTPPGYTPCEDAILMRRTWR